LLTLVNISPAQVVKLGGRHRTLKLRSFDYLAEECVSVEQHRVIEEDVVDADHFFFAQRDIGRVRVALVHSETDTEVRVVIEIGAGRDDPIDKAGFD